VLDGLQRGLTNRQIGQESYLSINTVKSHVQALYRRLGVSTREEVVARAYDLGLL
jgi:LuxR family maltose regulon positive regulatory protein